MAVCKKCGKNLKKTNSILSVESGSVAAQNEISKGDIIVAVDGKTVKSKDEIESALKDKTECKINISHKDQTRTISINEAKDFLKGIDFTDEDTCSSCGAKQKGSKTSFILIGLLVIVIISVIVVIGFNKNKKLDSKTTETIVKEKVEVKQEPSDLENKSILPETTIQKLESVLENTAKTTESMTRETEITFATDDSGKLVNLRDTIIDSGANNISINSTTRNENGSIETKKRTRRASTRLSNNDSLESTLQNVEEIKDTIIAKTNISDITEKLTCKIPFKYGSFLDMGKMSVEVEKYLLVQKLEDEKEEYASIILGLNDLVCKIPEDKRQAAVFIIMGYADPTLFNGQIEISERSAKFNTELSLKRAETIKSILAGKDFNIPLEHIVTYGYGYAKNEAETTNLERFRRVDVVVSF